MIKQAAPTKNNSLMFDEDFEKHYIKPMNTTREDNVIQKRRTRLERLRARRGGHLGVPLGKAAADIPLSPEESYLASQLFGKSLFSAIQLAKEQELQKSLSNRALSGKMDEDVLKIPIPAHLMQTPEKRGEDGELRDSVFGRALNFNKHPARMILGGQAGFRDAKKEYFEAERSNIQRELMQAQQEYMQLLEQIKTGSEQETPLVDLFCNGIADYTLFEKTADDPNIEDGSIKRLMGEALGVAKQPFKPAIDTVAGGLLSTGAGTAYLTYLLRKKMREEPDTYLEENLPTRVELVPYGQKQAAYDAASSIGQGVGSFLGNTVKDLGTKAWNNITAPGNFVKNTASDMVHGNPFALATNMSKAINNHFVGGLQSAYSNITAPARMAQGLVSGVRGAFSPEPQPPAQAPQPPTQLPSRTPPPRPSHLVPPAVSPAQRSAVISPRYNDY
jgi:hypothetical protein